jgi:hypothetical protein
MNIIASGTECWQKKPDRFRKPVRFETVIIKSLNFEIFKLKIVNTFLACLSYKFTDTAYHKLISNLLIIALFSFLYASIPLFRN